MKNSFENLEEIRKNIIVLDMSWNLFCKNPGKKEKWPRKSLEVAVFPSDFWVAILKLLSCAIIYISYNRDLSGLLVFLVVRSPSCSNSRSPSFSSFSPRIACYLPQNNLWFKWFRNYTVWLATIKSSWALQLLSINNITKDCMTFPVSASCTLP